MSTRETNYPLEYVKRLGWHEAFHSSLGNINSYASELAYLAECLKITGSTGLSNKLYGLSLAIDADVNVADLAIDTYIQEQVNASNAAIGNTLNAIMDVAMIGTRDKEGS